MPIHTTNNRFEKPLSTSEVCEHRNQKHSFPLFDKKWLANQCETHNINMMDVV